ncbi:abortive phage infection protein [Paenibacillus polymyxa]|nr:abortive phage infection protein [Paenibacillus polymyxa]
MNPIGKPVVLTANFKKLGLLGGVGLICFFIFQLLIPSLSNPSPESLMNAKVISKQEAIVHALDFARSELGYTESQPEKPVVTYQAETDLYGYLSREKLLQAYDRTWKKIILMKPFGLICLTPQRRASCKFMWIYPPGRSLALNGSPPAPITHRLMFLQMNKHEASLYV